MQSQHAQAMTWASAAVVIEYRTVAVSEDFPSAVPGRWPPAVDHDNSSNIFPLAYAFPEEIAPTQACGSRTSCSPRSSLASPVARLYYGNVSSRPIMPAVIDSSLICEGTMWLKTVELAPRILRFVVVSDRGGGLTRILCRAPRSM